MLLLFKDKLEPTNENVALTQSLGSILSSSSLQIDDGDVSVLHSTEFTFKSDVEIEYFKLIEEVIDFCDTSQLQSFTVLFTNWYFCLMCTSVFMSMSVTLIFSEHLILHDLVSTSLSELNCLSSFLSLTQWMFWRWNFNSYTDLNTSVHCTHECQHIKSLISFSFLMCSSMWSCHLSQLRNCCIHMMIESITLFKHQGQYSEKVRCLSYLKELHWVKISSGLFR